MVVPPIACRREIDHNLVVFFREHRPASFRRALTTFCRFYDVKAPKVRWFEYLDWGKTGGRTYEDGRIHLVHPENWKRGRIYNSERMWIRMIYHEMAHYLFWADPEYKADLFSRRMIRGLRRQERTPNSAARPGPSALRRIGRRTTRRDEAGTASRRSRKRRRS